ncbi:MAG: GDSL-type esterase/lipase family protein [Planctomycetota bacterium]
MRSIMALIVVVSVAHVWAGDANDPINTESYKEKIKVACVGDSITAGVGSKMPWPKMLQQMLGDKWDVKNYGISARTLLKKGDHPYDKEKMFQDAQNLKPDVVVIMLGTNDTKPQNWKFKDEFIADYKDMIGHFTKADPKPRTFACYAPFVPGKGNFGIVESGVLEQMPMIDTIAKETGSGIIDMHAALKDKDAMLPDRVHPNTDGATELAKTVFKKLTGKDFTGELKIEAPAPKKKKDEAK